MKIKGSWSVEKLIGVLKEVDQKARVEFKINVEEECIEVEARKGSQNHISDELIKQIQKANVDFFRESI